MPEQIERLSDQLNHHPDKLVRLWWARRRKAADQHQASTVLRGYEFVRIPGGTFTMGSPPGVGDYDERPCQEITLDSFSFGRYPATNAQYERFLHENPDVPKPEYWGDRRFNQPQQPVVGVSWYEAKNFCNWLGPNVTLPTEAQWEYACRAGTTTRYSFGEDAAALDHFGWYKENSGSQSQPVGQKEPNPFGLYDMHGNVFEWCEDRTNSNAGRADSYKNTKPRSVDGLRQRPRRFAYRIIRGGSWNVDSTETRSACRYTFDHVVRDNEVGFRPALVIPGSSSS